MTSADTPSLCSRVAASSALNTVPPLAISVTSLPGRSVSQRPRWNRESAGHTASRFWRVSRR